MCDVMSHWTKNCWVKGIRRQRNVESNFQLAIMKIVLDRTPASRAKEPPLY